MEISSKCHEGTVGTPRTGTSFSFGIKGPEDMVRKGFLEMVTLN